MTAEMNVNEKTIELALMQYFERLKATKVTLKTTPRYDYRDNVVGQEVSATITIDVGEAVPY